MDKDFYSIVLNFEIIIMNFKEYDELTIEAVKKVAPCVVSIVISKHLPKIKNTAYPFPLPPLFGGEKNDEMVKVGGGSGFAVHEDGLILTNKHVVFDPEAEYTVVTYDEEEIPAQVLSRDPVNDIAILKINKKGLKTVSLGDSSKLELGQTVVAIGNALGMFSNTVSKGIVSGLSRSISASMGGEGAQLEQLRGVLQTDVAINQGNSGGPLIDLEGRAVGINTAIIYGAQNIGFAIPINWAKTDLADIIQFGRIVKPYLGLLYVMLNKKSQTTYSLPVDYGALVVRDHRPNSIAVVPGSPAEKAGVKENDIILSLNGARIEKDLSDCLQTCKVGDSIELEVLRNDKHLKLHAQLEERK
jgi:serine protease Do